MSKEKKVGMAFGAFDGIHRGHIHYLSESRKKCDVLYVSVSRDKSAWKFVPRFDFPEDERLRIVDKLSIADFVILGSQYYAFEKILEVKPDILFITKLHHVSKEILEADLVKHSINAEVIEISVLDPQIYEPVYQHNKDKHKKIGIGYKIEDVS